MEFKEGSKSVRFITFNGRYRQAEKAVQFVKQFDAAFGIENFLSLHLTGITSAWWEAQTQDGTGPKHWKGFKKAFFKQFLPKEFKSHIMNAWDSLHMEARESIDDYNQRFWDYYL